jgi:alpha-L-fucosidase
MCDSDHNDHSHTYPPVLPRPRQIAFSSWERGLFFHFGILTFFRFENTEDYGKKPMPPEKFNPTQLDCDQWARTAKECGFKYMVLTTKHHDGFTLWPSKNNAFSVASSPWKNGKGDVVKEFVDACRKHDLKTGFYYSPYDSNEKSFSTDPAKYDEYFIGHMKELLGNYGKIDILWYDGCHSGGHPYNWPLITKEIRTLQPEILIFNSFGPDVLMFAEGEPDMRWIGNEDGYADVNVRNVIDSRPYSKDRNNPEPKIPRWLVPEADTRIRERNWFYCPTDDDPVKTVGELVGNYLGSCGRGCNLLLNIGPDQTGLLPEKDVQRLREFAAEIDRRYGHPLCKIEDCVQEGSKWIWTPKEVTLIDYVIAGEDLTFGERVESFAIVAETAWTRSPVVLYEGKALGARRICHVPALRTPKIWLEVRESDGEPVIKRLEAGLSGC